MMVHQFIYTIHMMSSLKQYLEVMDGNFSGMTHDFIIFVYICCPEVYQDIDDEHNIDYEINDYQRIVVSAKRREVGKKSYQDRHQDHCVVIQNSLKIGQNYSTLARAQERVIERSRAPEQSEQ